MLRRFRELVSVGQWVCWSLFGVCLRAEQRATDQLLTNSASWQSFEGAQKRTAKARKLLPFRCLSSTAGEGIRTLDVQLGKMLSVPWRKSRKFLSISSLAA
jgi:hypothetical protein